MRCNSCRLFCKKVHYVEHASEGDEIQFILDRTPFYAESGGQVADKGTISGETFVADVKDVQKAPNGQNLHTAIIRSGEMTKGAAVHAEVNQDSKKTNGPKSYGNASSS